MLNHYLKFFRRNFLRHKGYYFLNLLGFTLGFACFLFTMVYVFYEKSYDSYHENRKRIYRVTSTLTSGGNVSHTALANGFLAYTLPKEFPEITNLIRFKRFEGNSVLQSQKDNAGISVETIFFADTGVFNVFNYKLLKGNEQLCLADPNSIVLTLSTFKQIFSGQPSLDNVVILNGHPLKVTGVMEDLPNNSDLKFDGLISMETLPQEDISWAYTYLMFEGVEDGRVFQAKLNKYTAESIRPLFKNENSDISYQMEPMESVHFSNNAIDDTQKGNSTTVNIFFATGILVLVISCLNSINITIVKSFSQAKNICIRKISGASQASLVLQYVLESVFLGTMAVIMAFLIAWFCLSWYGIAIDRKLVTADLANWRISLSVLATIFMLGCGAAYYTGLYLPKIQLSSTLGSRPGRGQKMKSLSLIMLGFQFFISIGMIVAGIVIYRQVQYLKNRPLGFNATNVMIVKIPADDQIIPDTRYLKNQLDALSGVVRTSFCGLKSLPGQFTNIDQYEYQQQGVFSKKTVNNIAVDANYLSLLEVPVIKGSSFFSSGDSTDSHVIVTSLFAQNAGWNDPIGKTIRIEGEPERQVVGMVPDFHFSSLHTAIAPLLIFQDVSSPAYLLVKIKTGKTSELIKQVQDMWRNVLPDYPLNYFFLDQQIAKQYNDENNLATLILTLTLFIMIISCIGLIVYSAYIINMARREIAIKRVLGASFWQIFNHFNNKYIILLIIAFTLACPLTYYLLSGWLADFPYHINLRVVDYLLSFTLMGVIISGVLIYYAVQGVKANPVKAIQEG